ncbi:MAG: radical SAM protein [Candidatus Omnitrophota bacterium]
MNVFLVNLYYGPMASALVALGKKKMINPPLGLIQMATLAKEKGHRVTILDEQCVDGLTKDDYIARIRENRYDVVGFSVNTLNFNYFVQLCRYIKERIPDVILVAGGVHITALREQALHDSVDYLFLGEADHGFVEFLGTLPEKSIEKLKKIPGLLFRNGSEVVNTGRTLVRDLDALPFADRSLLDYKQFMTTLPSGERVLSTGISASRGCPFHCVFCSEQILSGNNHRLHSTEYVFAEMKYVQDTFGISHINFYDSTFNISRKFVLDLCRLIIDSGRKFTLWVGARASLLDREQLMMLKQAGLVRIGIAIESGNERILKLIKKSQTKEQLIEAFRMAAEVGVPAEAMAIIGNPTETFKEMFETAEFIRKIDTLDITSLGIAIPYPGTELYDMAKNARHGLKLLSEDWDNYHFYGPGVMEVSGYSPATLVFFQKILLCWSYLRWRKIVAVIRVHGFRDTLLSLFGFLFKGRSHTNKAPKTA